MTNLREIGLASRMYAGDYDGAQPPYADSWALGYWTHSLVGYIYRSATGKNLIYNRKIFECPSDTSYPGWYYAWLDENGKPSLKDQSRVSYAINVNGCSYNGRPDANGKSTSRVMLESDIEWPSMFLQFIDAKGPNTLGRWYSNVYEYEPDSANGLKYGQMDYRHNGSCVVAYADGHSGLIKKGWLQLDNPTALKALYRNTRCLKAAMDPNDGIDQNVAMGRF